METIDRANCDSREREMISPTYCHKTPLASSGPAPEPSTRRTDNNHSQMIFFSLQQTELILGRQDTVISPIFHLDLVELDDEEDVEEI